METVDGLLEPPLLPTYHLAEMIHRRTSLLPFRSEEPEADSQRIEEERRLMYVGITRARNSLSVSVLRRRKRGREFVPGFPSRFVAEMKLDEVVAKQDPRDRLKALREAAAERAQRAREALPPR